MSTNDFEIKYGDTKLTNEDLYFNPEHPEEYKNICCPGMTAKDKKDQLDRLDKFIQEKKDNEIYKNKNGEDDTYKKKKTSIKSSLSNIHKLLIYGQKYRDYTNNNNSISRERRKNRKQPNANKCSKPDNIISTTTTTTTTTSSCEIISKMEELRDENDKLRSKIEKKEILEIKELINTMTKIPQWFDNIVKEAKELTNKVIELNNEVTKKAQLYDDKVKNFKDWINAEYEVKE